MSPRRLNSSRTRRMTNAATVRSSSAAARKMAAFSAGSIRICKSVLPRSLFGITSHSLTRRHLAGAKMGNEMEARNLTRKPIPPWMANPWRGIARNLGQAAQETPHDVVALVFELAAEAAAMRAQKFEARTS